MTLTTTNNKYLPFTQEETEMLRTFYELKAKVDILEAEKKEDIKQYMIENDIKSFEDDNFKITYIPESVRKTVDTAKLKEQGLYEAFTKETKVKDSVRITLKWE